MLQVKSALAQAGYEVLGDADTASPGLRVTAVPPGALVGWTCSDDFASLARRHAGRTAGHDSMAAIVQIAVAGVLIHRGHTATQTPNGLLVSTDVITAPDDGDGQVPQPRVGLLSREGQVRPGCAAAA
ncbi:hypothetical protein ACFVP3_30840 [Streptomyces sp. NPDC057806]|uniref:hypothetical protein n=1 Tax=unclassified Streptomyces TaxID=2593676 RepID=UPI0036B24317